MSSHSGHFPPHLKAAHSLQTMGLWSHFMLSTFPGCDQVREEGHDHGLHPESLAIICLPKTIPSGVVEAATPAGPWNTFPARSHVVWCGRERRHVSSPWVSGRSNLWLRKSFGLSFYLRAHLLIRSPLAFLLLGTSGPKGSGNDINITNAIELLRLFKEHLAHNEVKKLCWVICSKPDDHGNRPYNRVHI